MNTDRGFPRALAGLRFDAVIVHYTVFASGPSPYLMDARTLDYLGSACDSYKVAFFQDEHQYCTKRFGFLDEYDFDCVFTCIEPGHYDATYRRYTKVRDLVTYVPAYVHPDMVSTAARLGRPDSEREVDIGYRARPTPPYFGRGGMEKVEIAEQVSRLGSGAGLRLDISVREQDRLYGEDWYRFIAESKAFLGTESGASCVDLEDEVRLEYERLSADQDGPVTIEQLERGALGRWDWKVPLRTTSARHFEAAALRTCQVMYEGRYSGVLRPMEHYIPLKKDHSNFGEVLERFRDAGLRRELTENAYGDLIASGEHSYERFIARFDATLAEAGIEPPGREVAGRREIERSLSRRPPHVVAWRYLGGASFRLYRRHPLIWRLTVFPLTVPVRLLSRLIARRERP